MPRLSVYEKVMQWDVGRHTEAEMKAAENIVPYPYPEIFGFPQWVFTCTLCGHEHPSESDLMGAVRSISDCQECSCSANNIQFVPPSRSFQSFSGHKGSSEWLNLHMWMS